MTLSAFALSYRGAERSWASNSTAIDAVRMVASKKQLQQDSSLGVCPNRGNRNYSPPFFQNRRAPGAM